MQCNDVDNTEAKEVSNDINIIQPLDENNNTIKSLVSLGQTETLDSKSEENSNSLECELPPQLNDLNNNTVVVPPASLEHTEGEGFASIPSKLNVTIDVPECEHSSQLNDENNNCVVPLASLKPYETEDIVCDENGHSPRPYVIVFEHIANCPQAIVTADSFNLLMESINNKRTEPPELDTSLVTDQGCLTDVECESRLLGQTKETTCNIDLSTTRQHTFYDTTKLESNFLSMESVKGTDCETFDLRTADKSNSTKLEFDCSLSYPMETSKTNSLITTVAAEQYINNNSSTLESNHELTGEVFSETCCSSKCKEIEPPPPSLVPRDEANSPVVLDNSNSNDQFSVRNGGEEVSSEHCYAININDDIEETDAQQLRSDSLAYEYFLPKAKRRYISRNFISSHLVHRYHIRKQDWIRAKLRQIIFNDEQINIVFE